MAVLYPELHGSCERDNIINRMGSLSKAPGASMGEAANWSELPKSEILAELERVLESHHFSASKKCSRFLRHIIEASADGRFDCLKERTLGVDVFEREPHYDTNQDPIVRGTAGEVRKRLAQYYQETATGTLRFTLPPGSYIPEVHPVVRPRAKSPALATTMPSRRSTARKWLMAAAAAIVCIAIAAGISVWPSGSPLDRFWAPILQGNTVLVCMGQPQLYTFRPDTLRVLNSWFDSGLDRRSSMAPGPVPLNEIVPLWEVPVALADAQAFSRLANLFAQKQKRVDMRGERSVTLSDLRGKPTVLIGAYDNDWTLSFGRDLRFYFDTDQRTHAQIIRDKKNPTSTEWQLVDPWPPGREITEDYALVTRVRNRTTEQTIVILAGILQYGTEAAAEFVTNSNYFQQALTNAPSDWAQKNIQVVLSTRVLAGVGGPPTVLAVYFW